MLSRYAFIGDITCGENIMNTCIEHVLDDTPQLILYFIREVDPFNGSDISL